MIFVHGFLHGDPHPGNILVSPENHQDFSIGMIFYLFMKILTNLQWFIPLSLIWLLLNVWVLPLKLCFFSWMEIEVLLDHGIYKELEEEFRQKYCQLWKALILRDSCNIQILAEQFGVGKYSRYLPVIFTGRTIDR